jgi:hypothetical protein
MDWKPAQVAAPATATPLRASTSICDDSSNEALTFSYLRKHYSPVIWAAFSETIAGIEGSNCQVFALNLRFLKAS